MLGFVPVIASLLGGCGKPETEVGNGEMPVVFVSVLPQMEFVKRIGGNHVEVMSLVGAGQDPHVYAVEPQQMIALGKASGLFTVGMPFEEPLVAKIKGTLPDLRIVDTSAEIEKLAGVPHEEEDHDHDHHDHGGEQDPHVWTAPLQIKKQALAIANALSEIDPGHAEEFRVALAAFDSELDALHLELGARLAPYKGKRFYVFHPAFAYFADEFGLEQVPVQIGGQTPTPGELADFVQHAKEDGIEVLFVQPQFDMRAAETIAKEVGAKVVVLDPLAENVVENLRAAADAIVSAFGGAGPP